MSFTFTSESVTEGHPDKMADQVSDSILDHLLRQDLERADGNHSRVACETFLGKGICLVGGEITSESYAPVDDLARQTINEIGYDSSEKGMDGNTCGVINAIVGQSEEIARGVSKSEETRVGEDRDDLDSQGAGDQGMMFGFACTDTKSLMPMPIYLAHRLTEKLAEVRKSEVIPYLYPDGKSQVTVKYEEGKPVGIDTVVISTQHRKGMDRNNVIRPDVIEHIIQPEIKKVFPSLKPVVDTESLDDNQYRVFVNPSGEFSFGGPGADTGLTGRKIIVDTYGGFARHGGGAFSGKDPSKVDRSATYAARWVAKNLVAADILDRCEVRVAYAIGKARPVDVGIEHFDTLKIDVDIEQIKKIVQEVFDLRPAAIIRDLDLYKPIYRKTAAYGHFGRDDFTWEQTDKAEDLKRELGI